MTTSTANATANPALPNEMSDRFGPMLVKELRQGLRTKVFLAAFIGFQVILLIMVLAGFASGSDRESAMFLNVTIWGLLMVMLLVITPLRGIMALEKEMRQGTLELLQITRLDAWKIVRGKWAAIMGEAMLYLAAALPYFTLRYFLGGVQILNDLGLLALLAVFSGAITAIVVGLSGFRSILLRVATAIALILLFPLGGNILEEIRSPYGITGFFFGVGGVDGWWMTLFAFVLTSIIVGWSFLRLGARTIATQAENHTTCVRLVTFGGMLALVALDVFRGNSGSRSFEPYMVFSFIFCLAIFCCGLFSAVTDSALQSTRIYRPFIKRNLTPIGRILLYPGWGSGIFYVILLAIPMLFLRLLRTDDESPQYVLNFILVFYNFFIQPAVLTRILMRNRNQRLFNLSSYIVMLVSCTLASAVLIIAEAAVTRGEPALSFFFPIPAMFGGFNDIELALGFQFFSAFVCTALLLIHSIEEMTFTQQRELAARRIMADSLPPVDIPEFHTGGAGPFGDSDGDATEAKAEEDPEDQPGDENEEQEQRKE